MEDFFIIPNAKIDSAWNPPDRSLEFFVLEYCEEELGIPLYLINDAYYTEEGIEITLKDIDETVAGEDWYIHLSRLAHYAKAS